MKKHITSHLHYYISLFIILFLGLCVIVLSKGNPQYQMAGVVMTAFFYVLWGVSHHILHHDTSVKNVIEYILIGALGVLLALLMVQ